MLPLDGMACPTNRRSPPIFISVNTNINMAKTKASKPKMAKKRTTKPRARKAGKRKTTNVGEYASLSETRTILASGGNLINTLYSLMNLSLVQFTRAQQVAQAYQHYRIKYVSLKFKSPADAFISGATNAYNKPFLYYMIDKAGAIPTNITLEGLKNMGAKPRALDENVITVGWRPSVLQDTMVTGGGAPVSQGSAYKISPWLNTGDVSVGTPWNPSSVDHLGCYWYLEAAGAGTPPGYYYEIDCEVQFEFKKPLIAKSVGAVHAVPATFGVQDASPDGIEGGSDGITIPMTT